MFAEPIESETVEIDVFNGIADAETTLTESGSIEIEFEEDVEVSPPEGFEDLISGKRVGKSTRSMGERPLGNLLNFLRRLFTQ